ncbi:MAG: SUMF1/EgtB/PvdO family nonheme iron enzyme, partial [Anaerolineales bacterium]|nr:SUMF1/EgtB/PvdO family nonheme iron enzyme [Anaerolineales bacterium]
VAKIVGGQQHTATGAMVGTVAYMSPEQIRGTKVDERADIYSLGVMLYEMTAGRPPFEGDSAMTVMFKQVNDPPPDIQQFNAAVPDELRGIIFKALEKEPAQRFQSAAEMARALRGLKLLETAVTPPAPATAVAPPPVLPATAVKPPEKTVAPPTPATVAAAPPEPAPAAAAPPLRAPPAAEPPARSAPPPAAPAQKRGLPIVPLIGLAVVILGGVIVFGFLRNRGQDRAANATASQAALAALATTPAPTQAPATAAPTQPPATATTAPTAVPPTRAPSATPPPPTAAPTRTVPPTETVVPIPAGMVLIPPGRFEMGSATGQADERPVHPVSLTGFFLDKFEVTNGRYQRCVDAGQCQPPAQRGSFTRAAYFTAPDFADFPVIQVTWDQAVAFCTFEGKRLPTEAEWEYAARGGTERVFPWGDAFEPARVPATSRDTVAVGTLDNASPFGVLDMSGNVNEWVADWYARAYLAGPAENPLGPDRGARRVYRGGSFDNSDGAFYTTTRRYNQFPGFHDADVGFRCAQSLP